MLLSPYPLFHSLRMSGMPRLHRCEPGWRWAPRPLPDYDIWYVIAGEGMMWLDGQQHNLRHGVSFVLTPGCRPSAVQDPERRLQVFSAHFEPLGADGEVVDLTAPGMGIPPPGRMVTDRAEVDALTRRCAGCGERGDPNAVRQVFLLMEQILLHFWEEAARPAENPADRAIRSVAASIRDMPGEDWEVEAQAESAFLSRSQYTRRFTRLFGVSPAQFVIETRLDRAAQLLQETDMTVGEIADVLGYRDLFFFSRQFKAHRGLPPSELRRRRSGGEPLTSVRAAELLP